MIYTLTTNPAIDMNVRTTDIVLGKVNRTTETFYSPNGKGLNVSFVLGHFGIETEILGFFGGFSGEYILNECKKRGYKVNPVNIEGINRINVFVETDHGEYKLVNKGPFVSDAEQQKLMQLLSALKEEDLLVISGSLAAGMDDTIYDKILQSFKERGTRVILDIGSKKLKGLLKYNPLLIKPNDEELKDIFSFSITDEAAAVRALKYLHEQGAQNVLLTMGEKGSYFYDGKSVWFCEAYPIIPKSATCSGDGYLGAFLSVWLKDESCVEQALKLASATGADIAENFGLGEYLMVDSYKGKIAVKKVSEV